MKLACAALKDLIRQIRAGLSLPALGKKLLQRKARLAARSG